MSDNLVVRTTVDFLLGSAKNLDLALQVEEAMPQLRADLIGEFLKSVEAELSTDGWRVHKSNVNLLKAKAGLEICGLDWPIEGDPTERTSIRLSTDTAVWAQVYAGVYLSKMMRNRIRECEQEIVGALQLASAKLPSGRVGSRMISHENSEIGMAGPYTDTSTNRYAIGAALNFCGIRSMRIAKEKWSNMSSTR